MSKQQNSLAQDFNAGSLFQFAFPTILMMVFMGLYTVVDTIFIARFVNLDALAAINIACPVINLIVGLGTMLATGGNAVIARSMGEGRANTAKEYFTLIFIAVAVLGVLISITGLLWTDYIVLFLGAAGPIFPYCKDYLFVLFLFVPANMIQTLFANLFVTAGKPGLGSALSISAGIANIFFDYVFIVRCDMGIRGAALGTGCGYLIPAIAGITYFLNGKGTLAFRKPQWKFDIFLQSCLNGSSEMVSQLANAVTTFLFNHTMLHFIGEDGVAAITIIIYAQFLLNTLFIGFSIGTAPIIGYNFGSQNLFRLKKILRICLQFIILFSVIIFILSFFGHSWLIQLFAEHNSNVYRIAEGGFRLFSSSFLFCGMNIFVSSMFTALSDGRKSAVLSFLRTFIFLTGCILVLPRLLGITGIWLAVPLAEGAAFIVSIGCLLHNWNNFFC